MIERGVVVKLVASAFAVGFFIGDGFRPPTWAMAAVAVGVLLVAAVVDRPEGPLR